MTNDEERRRGPRWRRQATGIAAGLAALVLSVSALALAAALAPGDPPLLVSAAAPRR